MMKKTLAAALLALLLAACGGGGGGGAPTGATQPTVGDNGTGLALANVSPSQVQSELYEGEYVPSVTLSATLNGDITLLAGKPLYIFAVVPDPLFMATPSVQVDAASRRVTITLQGVKSPAGPKTYSNAITIRACLDTGCQREIGNSNISIPYAIVVKKGLSIGLDRLELRTTFGTYPAPATVAVGLPDGVQSWSVAAIAAGTYSSSNSPSPAVDAVKAADGSGILVSAKRLYKSNYPMEASVRVTAITASGKTLFVALPITYVTGPSSIPYVLSQGHTKITLKANSPYLAGDDVVEFYAEELAPLRPKYWLMLKGKEYIEKPANASLDFYPAYPGGWLNGSIGSYPYPPIWDVKALGCYQAHCLPVGHYTAIARYAVTMDGIQELDVLTYSVDLDIVP